MKHLVLGSRGQVGQYVVRELLARNQHVVEWDIQINKNQDLRSGGASLVEAMKECSFVHFLASDVGGSKYLASKQDSFEFIQNNVLIMDNVFSALRIAKKPFYFTSSQMSTMGHSTYGRLKAVGESYTKSLGGRIVRFWNVYGLETDPDKSHVITDFIRMAQDGDILCRTNGEEMRQFVYAKDVAEILVDITEGSPYTSYDPLEITNSDWVKIKDLAKMVAKMFGADTYFNDKVDEVQGVLNEPDHRIYFEFVSLEDGIKDIIKEMKKQL